MAEMEMCPAPFPVSKSANNGCTKPTALHCDQGEVSSAAIRWTYTEKLKYVFTDYTFLKVLVHQPPDLYAFQESAAVRKYFSISPRKKTIHFRLTLMDAAHFWI